MKDRVPLYPGRVKLTPVSGQENTYDMVRADEPTQEGTPLNKAALLKDATAALFGLDENAVPDDALALLSRFQKGLGNDYVWDKVIKTYAPKYTEYIYTTKSTMFQIPKKVGTVTVHYGDSYTVNLDGTVSIPNESTFTCDYDYPASTFNVLKGKWWWSTKMGAEQVYFLPAGTTLSREQDSMYSNYYSSIGSTTRTDFIPYYEVEHVEYVNSNDPNAYPPAVSDGYTYTALGQLGNKVQIATGSYVGTGTHGSSNPNSLTFEFIPKVVIVYDGKEDPPFLGNLAILTKAFGIAGSTYFSDDTTYGYVGLYGLSVKAILNTISWSSVHDERVQLNSSGQTYDYIAIG